MPVFRISNQENSEFSRYAILILSAVSLYSTHVQHAEEITGMSKEIAQQLSHCLDDTAINATTRMLAIQLIGQGWDLWQKFVNPFGVLQSLIDLLYKNGFVAIQGSGQLLSAAEPEILSDESQKIRREFIKRCRQSIREIAIQNSTLLASVLSIYIRSPEHLVDARIAALRLLTSFITKISVHQKGFEDALLNEVHIPNIIANIVHLLEPANATTREVSATGGVSLINEITQFLSTALQQYPSTLAFHKSQQRLAVALFSNPSNSSGSGSSLASSHAAADNSNLMLGFVYDLRSGTAMAMLSAHASCIPVPPPTVIFNGRETGSTRDKNPLSASDGRGEVLISPGITQLTDITFSPDGKHLAGFLTAAPTSAEESYTLAQQSIKIMVVWKIGFGFMSLLHNMALSLPSSAPSAASTPLQLSRAASPDKFSAAAAAAAAGAGTATGGGGGTPGTDHLSSPSAPSTPAVVIEDHTAAHKLTVYPKLLKAVRVPAATGLEPQGGEERRRCTLKWKNDKVLTLACGPGFAQDVKISS